MRLTVLFMVCLSHTVLPYSIFRPQEPDAPHFSVRQEGCTDEYELWDCHARIEHLRLAYNHDHFCRHMLPITGVTRARHTNQVITNAELDAKLNRLVKEVLNEAKQYTDFTVLKNKDFNTYQKTGLLIVELKGFPLVVKLFVESASSMTRPYGRGMEMASIFLAGGAWRHTEGFSRIQNIEKLKRCCDGHPRWADRVVFPRKWFWMPSQQRWLNFTIYNIGKPGIQQTRMPGIYAVVCDKLTAHPDKKPSNDECLSFCTHVEYCMDPHVRNFFIEKETGKLAVIDTEFFPWLLGFRTQIPPVTNYVSWYSQLSIKVAKDKFLTSKAERRKRQYECGKNCYYCLHDTIAVEHP